MLERIRQIFLTALLAGVVLAAQAGIGVLRLGGDGPRQSRRRVMLTGMDRRSGQNGQPPGRRQGRKE